MKLNSFVLLLFPRNFKVLMCVPAERGQEKERESGGDRKSFLNLFHGGTLLGRIVVFQRAGLGHTQTG